MVATRVVVSVPLTMGWSPNGYYQDAFGADTTEGFFSAGLKASIELPVRFGNERWYFKAGISAYTLLADSTQFANGDDDVQLVTSAGISGAF